MKPAINVSLNSNTKNDFILVPTSVKGNKVVKKRLVLFEENDNNRVNDDITVTPPKHFSTPVTKLRINSTKNQVSFEQHTGLKKKQRVWGIIQGVLHFRSKNLSLI